ncbi:MAG: DUF6498-containing protein [Candidatus Diapherotrites archaeon]|nr:DUF6498-containing protein [Candidatus Diapherotrites archaeon]
MKLRNLIHWDITAISLLAANLITICFAVVENWSLLTLVWIYWCQGAIIGIFNFIKILRLKEFSAENIPLLVKNRPVQPTRRVKFLTAIFFAILYGFFQYFTLAFLGIMTLFSILLSAGPPGTNDSTLGIPKADFASLALVPIAAAVFFVNHLVSFLFYSGKTKKKQDIWALVFFPFERVAPMYLLIFMGVWFGSEQITIVFFLLLKTALDVWMHSIEHRGQWPPEATV